MINSKERIKSLIKILEESKINSMEVSSFWSFFKVKLSKSKDSIASNNFAQTPVVNPTINQDTKASVGTVDNTTNKTPIQDSIANNNSAHTQKAPLVGTVYLSPKPDEDNFIIEGNKIKKGDTICIIEAMKIFNEIESEISGTVKKIHVSNESPVEFGQDLIEIIPD